jgi:hypothetical protein
MSMIGMENLHSLLNGEGRELRNVKFFPGTSRGLTLEQVEEAAKESFKRAIDGGLKDQPPMSNRAQKTL